MLELKFIRNNIDDIEQMLQNRNTDVIWVSFALLTPKGGGC